MYVNIFHDLIYFFNEQRENLNCERIRTCLFGEINHKNMNSAI